MYKKYVQLVFCLTLSVFALTSNASVITTTAGDIDNLGGAINSGDTSFLGPFDNRSASELAATNGAQYTDWSFYTFGTTLANTNFVFDYALDGDIVSAQLVAGMGGIQSQNDSLFLDGALLSNIFPEQGAYGYDGAIVWDIDATFFNQLVDNSATFTFNFNRNNSGEPVVVDYVSLIITTTASVPEPASLFLLGLGLLGFGFTKKRNA